MFFICRLYQDESPHSKLKLIDFGFSRIWKINVFMKQTCGSAAYVAPEVLSRKYTSQCDLWSIGVIVFMLLSGRPPFFGNETVMLNDIAEGRYRMKPSRWANISADAKNFVSSLLVVNPDLRMDAEKALLHPWIAERAKYKREVPKQVCLDMVKFASSTRFRRAVLTMLAYSLSSEELMDLHDVFLSLDKSNRGIITVKDFISVMHKHLDISNKEIEHIFESLDMNDDQEISYSEFVSAMLQHQVTLFERYVNSGFWVSCNYFIFR